MLPEFIENCNLKFFMKHTNEDSIISKQLLYYPRSDEKNVRPLIATACIHSELYDKLFVRFDQLMNELNMPWYARTFISSPAP